VEAVCRALANSHFHCEPSPDALALKYRKLLLNLGNGVEVIVGESAWGAPGPLGEFVEELRQEALTCYAAAGIEATPQPEYVERVTRHYRAQPVGGEARNGSSTLQSILRGHDTTEVDYLNGEIALLSQLTGVPAPLNTAVREFATRMARERLQPGSVTLEEVRSYAAKAAAAQPA
jgi:2-dehydropantoate 2-reductase